jgi:hypothetical protein
MKLSTNGKGSDMNMGSPKKNMFDVSCNCSKRFERNLDEIETHDH